MQPSKLVSKQKPVTAAVDADPGRAGRMVAGVTTLQRGTTRPNTEEATCIVRDGPMGGKERPRKKTLLTEAEREASQAKAAHRPERERREAARREKGLEMG